MTFRRCAILMSLLVLIVAAPSQVFAEGRGDRVQFFQSINVTSDETVGDVVCLFCSIHMSGTSGDTVAIMGDIIVDGTIKGDVVSVGGGVKLDEDANVSGDAVAIGRGLYRHPNATIKGETVSQSGPLVAIGLFIGLVVIPLLPIILIVALIVWLVRRPRYAPPAQAAYRR